MNGVTVPLSISDYYPTRRVGPIEPPYEPAQPITATTPYVHDITFQNIVATGAISKASSRACRNPASTMSR